MHRCCSTWRSRSPLLYWTHCHDPQSPHHRHRYRRRTRRLRPAGRPADTQAHAPRRRDPGSRARCVPGERFRPLFRQRDRVQGGRGRRPGLHLLPVQAGAPQCGAARHVRAADRRPGGQVLPAARRAQPHALPDLAPPARLCRRAQSFAAGVARSADRSRVFPVGAARFARSLHRLSLAHRTGRHCGRRAECRYRRRAVALDGLRRH
ncbi:hypothetical protein D9M68_798940 [compost metagenome]